jgi:hypothetical protein
MQYSRLRSIYTRAPERFTPCRGIVTQIGSARDYIDALTQTVLSGIRSCQIVEEHAAFHVCLA